MAESPNSSEMSSPESPDEVPQEEEDDDEEDEDNPSEGSESPDSNGHLHNVDDEEDDEDEARGVEELSESSGQESGDEAHAGTPEAVMAETPAPEGPASPDSASRGSSKNEDDGPMANEVAKRSPSPLPANEAEAPPSPRPKVTPNLSSSLDKPRGLDSLEGELDFEAEVHVKEERDDAAAGEDVEEHRDEKPNLEGAKVKKEGGREEGEQEEGEQDDGEVSGDDDLEEGEVKDGYPDRKARPPPVCRFFNRGQCTWGSNCRFIHPGVNDKGNYNMFAPSGTNKAAPPMGLPPPPPMGPLPMPNPRMARGPDFFLPPPLEEPPPIESAWERGLRHAKEQILKKASRRKEQEPDFEEKRLNLTIEGPDRGGPADYEKDDYYGRSPFRRPAETYAYYGMEEEAYDTLEREAREYWRGGRYENFEVRWPRQEYEYRDPLRERERERVRPAFRPSYERENPARVERRAAPEKDRWRDGEVQIPRSRGDEWRDPWRRSKTPKGRRSTSRSRGRSHRSYSSGSSRSYSSGSSKSSYSYSHSSSSRSSYYSSRRSRSHSRNRRSPSVRRLPPDVPNKAAAESNKRRAPIPPRRPSPPAGDRRKRATPPTAAVPPPAAPARRRNETDRYKKARSPSYSGSESHRSASRSLSRSSSSRSRSPSRSPSRSYSRSLSMSSVSSASSRSSRSSTESEGGGFSSLLPKRGVARTGKSPKKAESASAAVSPGADTPKAAPHEKAAPKPGTASRSSQRDAVRSGKEHDKAAGHHQSDRTASAPIQHVTDDAVPSSYDSRRSSSAGGDPPSSSRPLPTMIPSSSTSGGGGSSSKTAPSSKDPLKQSGHKQQIKLTLLNKGPPSSRDDAAKTKNGDRGEDSLRGSATTSNASKQPSSSRKRPPSPSSPVGFSGSKASSGGSAGGGASSGLKKSTSSRREELLKQLKAVEDAIARKRAKLN